MRTKGGTSEVLCLGFDKPRERSVGVVLTEEATEEVTEEASATSLVENSDRRWCSWEERFGLKTDFGECSSQFESESKMWNDAQRQIRHDPMLAPHDNESHRP
jgi:hypothetical protein